MGAVIDQSSQDFLGSPARIAALFFLKSASLANQTVVRSRRRVFQPRFWGLSGRIASLYCLVTR
jgi:hypothetical protein